MSIKLYRKEPVAYLLGSVIEKGVGKTVRVAHLSQGGYWSADNEDLELFLNIIANNPADYGVVEARPLEASVYGASERLQLEIEWGSGYPAQDEDSESEKVKILIH